MKTLKSLKLSNSIQFIQLIQISKTHIKQLEHYTTIYKFKTIKKYKNIKNKKKQKYNTI